MHAANAGLVQLVPPKPASSTQSTPLGGTSYASPSLLNTRRECGTRTTRPSEACLQHTINSARRDELRESFVVECTLRMRDSYNSSLRYLPPAHNQLRSEGRATRVLRC